jgi:hypothetical protein
VGEAYNRRVGGPGWLNQAGRGEAPYPLLRKAYEEGLDYYAKLKRDGQLIDMTMSEFAAHYRRTHAYMQPEVALWKDILYGSQKEYFWYYDPFFRTCLDFNQGGAMIDLRPYAAKLDIPVGIGTGNAYDATYPYIIEANYRAGYFTHYAGQGTIGSCRVTRGGETVDLCLERTMASVSMEGPDIRVTTDPFVVAFAASSITMRSSFLFRRGTGQIEITREIAANPTGEAVAIEEYLVGCYGREEYSLDMTGLILEVESAAGRQTLNYEYRCRSIEAPDAISRAIIPQIKTIVELRGDEGIGQAEEGFAFSPMFRLSRRATLAKGGFTTCLSLRKAA